LGKKDKAFFNNIKDEDFGKMVRKSRGGLLKKIRGLVPNLKNLKDKDKVLNKLDEISDTRTFKGGAYLTALIALLDGATYLTKDNDPKKAAAKKKEIEGAIDYQIDAEKYLQQQLEESKAELEAELGQEDNLSPVDASVRSPATPVQRYLNDASVYSGDADDFIRLLTNPYKKYGHLRGLEPKELYEKMVGYYGIQPEIATRILEEYNKRSAPPAKPTPLQFQQTP
jgi:hypothetical protein